MGAKDTNTESPEGVKLDECLAGMDSLFARIDALSNPELRKLVLRDLMEQADAMHGELE